MLKKRIQTKRYGKKVISHGSHKQCVKVEQSLSNSWILRKAIRYWTSVVVTEQRPSRQPGGGANVQGVDIAENLVVAGNNRAEEEGLTNITFLQGDACDLINLRDNSFDIVVSIFGAMFAPKPINVAKEMVRVTKPGGRIVMGNWIPGDPTLVAQILKISSSYTPPPPEGFISPMLWGVETHVTERFAAAGIPG